MFKEHTYIIVKLKVPEAIQGDHEAIDNWLNNLEYEFQDLTADENEGDPSYPGRVETEIVENQFNFVTGL